ncbi:xyloglucan:xyloglucosyl transferase [Ranunculus cassubicifolius]
MLSSLFFFMFFMFMFAIVVHGDFNADGKIIWREDHVKITENGSLLQLTLDEASGSGYQLKDRYLFGEFQMKMKLVPGYSAGTVTTFYLRSEGNYTQDEIDFEFIGNIEGEPYTVSTNIITQGKGNREQHFKLWFNPTEDFHIYSILWNLHQILLSVDGIPIRTFPNIEEKGVPYLKDLPMNVTMTIWHASWVEKRPIDWSHAPFVASYRDYGVDACVWAKGKSFCPLSKKSWWDKVLDPEGEEKLKLVQTNSMTYNYCTDTKRFTQGLPPECSLISYA